MVHTPLRGEAGNEDCSKRLPTSKRNDLHRYFHIAERVCRPFPHPGNRTSLFLFAGDRDGNMLVARKLVVGRIETAPTRTGNVNFRPGMGGAMLTFRHLNIPTDKSRSESPVPCSFHHEHRKVAARTTAARQRIARQLDARIVAVLVAKSSVDFRVQVFEKLESSDGLP